MRTNAGGIQANNAVRGAAARVRFGLKLKGLGWGGKR
jgi:hypothetical protein